MQTNSRRHSRARDNNPCGVLLSYTPFLTIGAQSARNDARDIAPVAAYSYLASVNNFALPAYDPSSNSKPAPAQRLLTSKVRLNRAAKRWHGSLSNRQPFGVGKALQRASCEHFAKRTRPNFYML
jgi:hypothetical protein